MEIWKENQTTLTRVNSGFTRITVAADYSGTAIRQTNNTHINGRFVYEITINFRTLIPQPSIELFTRRRGNSIAPLIIAFSFPFVQLVLIILNTLELPRALRPLWRHITSVRLYRFFFFMFTHLFHLSERELSNLLLKDGHERCSNSLQIYRARERETTIYAAHIIHNIYLNYKNNT